MKRTFIHFTLVTLLVALASYGQTNFHEQVSQLWFDGYKGDVLAIANTRLQADTNDIAGLILKMEYEMEYLELQEVTNTMARVIDVGTMIETEEFSSLFPLLEGSIIHLINMIPLYPTNELAADIDKANIAGKSLSFGVAIKALQDDGYFDE
ncbi:MAG: hypothetical protein LBN38_01070 [Verrucomicrobiota bacterium]|jgi:hypothetical protein|nr:hypothetical protein [Verrucomicrobiota bacterium]